MPVERRSSATGSWLGLCGRRRRAARGVARGARPAAVPQLGGEAHDVGVDDPDGLEATVGSLPPGEHAPLTRGRRRRPTTRAASGSPAGMAISERARSAAGPEEVGEHEHARRRVDQIVPAGPAGGVGGAGLERRDELRAIRLRARHSSSMARLSASIVRRPRTLGGQLRTPATEPGEDRPVEQVVAPGDRPCEDDLDGRFERSTRCPLGHAPGGFARTSALAYRRCPLSSRSGSREPEALLPGAQHRHAHAGPGGHGADGEAAGQGRRRPRHPVEIISHSG